MATIVFNRMAQLLTDYVLGASGTITPPSAWTMGLSTTVVGSGANMARNSVWSVTISGSKINEIASTTAGGYARQTIAKSINTGSVDWGTSTLDNTFATGGCGQVLPIRLHLVRLLHLFRHLTVLIVGSSRTVLHLTHLRHLDRMLLPILRL